MRGNTMSCVYEAEPVSFSCILDVVSDVRSGKVTVETARKIIKQVDGGLAQFGMPKPVGFKALPEEDLLTAVEDACKVEGIDWSSKLVQMLPLLMQLLQIVLAK